MALFQIFRGSENELLQVPRHNGYAYFCEDTGNFFIDIGNGDNDRVPINAFAAQILREGTTEVEIDDIFLKSMVASIQQGGTGASDAASARTNLEVYSKTEVEDQATTKAFTATLTVGGWVQAAEGFTYTWSNTDLKCGKSGDVPPIITYTSNLTDYSKINSDNTVATAGQGIVFQANSIPLADIGLIIIDVR